VTQNSLLGSTGTSITSPIGSRAAVR
jgi:hypothetical protein